MVATRRKARELALQLLYQLDFSGEDWEATARLFLEEQKANSLVKDFCLKLVQGVWEQKKEIDDLIEQFSEHWRLPRMAQVDRNIIRLAAYELLYCPDVPEKVVINEGIELGKRFGSDDSSAFINAILDKIRLCRTLQESGG